MGALIAAQAGSGALSWLTGPLMRCGGYCFGPCLATCFCKCAGGGSVGTNFAARCVLLWLQALTAVLALVVSSTPWLTTPCTKLEAVGVKGLGVCECMGQPDRTACWSEQLVWRVEGSAFLVFAVMLLLTLSGCAKQASRSLVILKFLGVLLLGAVSLFVPNSVFSIFGTFASFGSAAFLVAQSLLVAEVADVWNKSMFNKANDAERGGNRRCARTWKAAILCASAVFLVSSVVISTRLYGATPSSLGKVVDVGTLVVSCILLVVSITVCWEHGSLLLSSVMMAYSMWVLFEACTFTTAPNGPGRPSWISLLVAALSLAAFARASQQGGSDSRVAMLEAGAGDGAGEESVAVEDYAKHCLVHGAAATYVASALAPQVGDPSFYAHLVAVTLVLFLYGWSLIAPKTCLKNRNFNRSGY